MRRVLSTDPSSGFFMGPGLSEHLSPKVDLTKSLIRDEIIPAAVTSP